MKAVISTTILLISLIDTVHAVPLISETEANLPAAAAPQTRSISRGPGIIVESPSTAAVTLTSPFNLKVAFKAHGGATIDPNNVKIVYLKAPAIDLSERLKPSISADGINFSDAEVPAGKHSFQVILEDSEGRTSNAVIDLNVVK